MLDDTDVAANSLALVVAGQYRLDREVGRGGMGVVYLAIDEQLQRQVAIKTLPPHLAADALVRDRFLREARTAGGLSHQNIVPIYSAAERDGIVYFVMRYIAGESLAERLSKSKTLPVGDVIDILRQLASALAYAHARGIVHRDIKAENVLLDAETGRAMLTDFGIARLAETKPLTATGTVLGTVQYMSPEQVMGDVLDGRSDLYAVGVLAFLMLSGHFPFERNTPSAVLVAHVNSKPPKLCDAAPGVAKELGEIVDRLLAKSPDDRFANGDALRHALDSLPTDASAMALVPNDAAPLARRTPNGTPELLSSTEAQEVWARAAELQANTGLLVPPPEFSRRGEREALVTRGYDATLVRESAIDAGIDGKYVERALAERARSAPVVIESGPQMQRPINPLAGARLKLDYETTIDGELNEIGFEEIADEVRRQLGEMVTVSAVGRTMTVTTAMTATKQGFNARRIQINISSRNGRTHIRANEDLSQMATGWFVGLTMGGGFGGGMAMMGAVIGATQKPLLGLAAMLTWVGVAYGCARHAYARNSRKREAELKSVTEKIAQRAQEFVIVGSDVPKKLGRSNS